MLLPSAGESHFPIFRPVSLANPSFNRLRDLLTRSVFDSER